MCAFLSEVNISVSDFWVSPRVEAGLQKIGERRRFRTEK